MSSGGIERFLMPSGGIERSLMSSGSIERFLMSSGGIENTSGIKGVKDIAHYAWSELVQTFANFSY